MLSIFKKFFGKPAPKAVVATHTVPLAQNTPMPTIQVAHLSLPAIVARFPDELKSLLAGEPDPAATVALPLPTILKQLPTGTVKMSLASLHRQAHGIIKPLPPGDKRTIEVPLSEIFRHVKPESLRRRADQRPIHIPESGFNLFGDSENPYAIAPDDVVAPHDTFTHDRAVPPEPQVLDLTADVPRVLKMDDGLRTHFGNGNHAEPEAEAEAAEPEIKLEMPADVPPPAPHVIAPPPDFSFAAPQPVAAPELTHAPAPVAAPAFAPVAAAVAPVAAPAFTPAAPKPESTTLALPLTALAAGWPEEIRTEIAALDPATTVSLPVDEVKARLAKGRVMFSWKQIHSWLEPQAATPSAVSGETALQLPLKVVAPAFLSSSNRPAAERKSREVDASIPALFSDGRPPAEEPAPEPAQPAAEPVHEAPAAEAAHEPAHEPAPEKLPETVGEIFHQPHKQDWTPSEIVAGTVTLPGVAGAIVALQEGLQVASSLPEGVKSEVVAAFLPQIFARLNQYAGEMRLGDVDDLLFTTHGAHCQIYRLGYVYFAVLGKAGESLPWHELRLITEELARQTHK